VRSDPIHRQYRAWPIIQTNPCHKKLMGTVGLAEATPEWKAIYSQRTAVERVFSRVKGQHPLNRVTTRRIRKVTAHCYLSLIALQAVHGVTRCQTLPSSAHT
jgi:hypothetical protein